jgi:hypothetical protein
MERQTEQVIEETGIGDPLAETDPEQPASPATDIDPEEATPDPDVQRPEPPEPDPDHVVEEKQQDG